MNFEQIEDAMLTEANTKMTYLGQPPETYGGQLEGDIESIPINYPAVFTVFDGATLNWVDGTNFNEEDTFTLLACSNDVRGNASLRKNSDTGCYRMIKDFLKNFSGKDLGLDIYPFLPIRIYPVFITRTLAVYGVKFKTNFDTTYG